MGKEKEALIYNGELVKSRWQKYVEQNKLSFLMKDNLLDILNKMDLVEVRVIQVIRQLDEHSMEKHKSIILTYRFEDKEKTTIVKNEYEMPYLIPNKEFHKFVGMLLYVKSEFLVVFDEFIRQINHELNLGMSIR